MDKKQIFAILMVVLMFMGAFAVLSSLAPPDNPSQNSPALSSISETSSNSIAVNYFSQSSVANSGTTTVHLPVTENSSQNSISFSASQQLSISSGTASGSISLPSYYYCADTSIGGFGVILPLPTYNAGDDSHPDFLATVGTVYMNLSSSDGATCYWSYTFNYLGSGSTQTGYIEVYPSFSFGLYLHTSYTLSISITSDSSDQMTGFADVDTTATGSSADAPNPFSYSGTSNSVVINPSSVPSESSQPFAYGWHFNSASLTFTIPQYTTSYDVSWSSSSSVNPQYNGQSPTGTSGTLTGSLTSNSITVNPESDPPDVSSDGASTFGFSYYLSSQYQISSNSTSDSSTSSYTYSQVTATTNEASSSFSFSASTPSNAVFISYETSNNSLATSTSGISFTPTSTVTNPYYSYAQNDLVASLSGASSGSSNTSSTQNPSFTGGTASYTSSSTPSWTVDLNLYGNRHPTYDNSSLSLTTVNPETPITLFANYSEAFSGESQHLVSDWNGYSETSNSSSTNEISQTYYFRSTGLNSLSFYAVNSPDPSSNGLSSLDSSTTTDSVNVIPFALTPDPTDYSIVNASVPLSLSYSSQTAAKITTIDLSVNGYLVDRFQPDAASGKVSYTFTQPSPAPIVVTWRVSDQYGYAQSITFQYGSNLNPSAYSNKVTVLQSPNATHSYPISLSDVPSGTGYYQQLLTISNPSQYGINKAGSNIQFTASNGTLLYAWIQSINSSSMQVWVKNYNGSSTINMQVLPSFENVFSENGYLGNTTYNNFYHVFTKAYTFKLTFDNTLNGTTAVNTSGSFTPIATPNGIELMNGVGSQGTATIMPFGILGNTTVRIGANFTGGADAVLIAMFGNSNSLDTPFTLNGHAGGNAKSYSNSISVQGEFYNSIMYLNNLQTGTYTSGSFVRGPNSVILMAQTNGFNTFEGGYELYGNNFDAQTPPIQNITSGPSSNFYFGYNHLAILGSDGGTSSYQFLKWIDVSTYYPNYSMPTYTIGNGTNLGNPVLFNIQNILNIVNDTMKTVNLNLSNKVSILDSLITNENVSIQDKLTAINSEISTVDNNITVFQSYVKDTINNTENNIRVIDLFINSTVKAVNNNLTLYQSFLNSSIHQAGNNVTLLQNYVKDNVNNTVNNIQAQQDFFNTTLHTFNNNVTLMQNYLDTTINTTITNIYDYDVFIESTIKNLNNNVTLETQFVNDSVNRVSNNLTLFNNYVRTTINSTITSISLTTSITNSIVHDVSTNITLFNNYVHDTINATITSIHDENLIINSTVKAVDTNLTLFNTYVHDTINSTLSTINIREQYMNDTIGVISNNISLLQTYTKDVIHSEITNLTFINKYINDTMNNLNLSFNDKVAILNSTLNNVNLNATTYFNLEHDIMNNIKANQTDIYHAEELSGTYSYKLIPENVTTVSGGIQLQLWVENHDGTIVNNKQLVYYMYKNLTAEIMNTNNVSHINVTLISYNSRYMVVEFHLTSAQITNLQTHNNNTLVQLYTPFAIGGVSNIATGAITSTTTSIGVSGIWLMLGFTSNPPAITSFASVGKVVVWLMDNAGGRLMAGIVAIATLLYFVYVISKSEKEKRKQKTRDAREDETYKALKEIKQKLDEA